MNIRATMAFSGLSATLALGLACGGGGSGGGGAGATGGTGTGAGATGGTGTGAGGTGGTVVTGGTGGTTATTGTIGGTGGTTATTMTTGGTGGMPEGWLFTIPGDNKIHVADGGAGTVWMGRGVNLDDIFLCGYNYGLWMDNPDGEQSLLSVVDTMMTEWKPTFVRVSLAMNSFDPVVDWAPGSAYRASMTHVVNAIGAHPGTYVLVTLRSAVTMVDAFGNPCAGGGDDAICIPTPGTDDVYRGLVDAFKDAPFVLFGVANEPGGQSSSDQDLWDSMSHAVDVIRAEEDLLGVPHHIVSVQGNQWTSKIGYYSGKPLPQDNVVYEYHSYPPVATGNNGYTWPNIPVIVGEYGPAGDPSAVDPFHADVEVKQIPNLAWTLSAYSNCSPDLVKVTFDSSLQATAWGAKVKSYLLAH